MDVNLTALRPHPQLQIDNALAVEILLERIAMATGTPVKAFRHDALEWCATRVSTAEQSLRFALTEYVMAGKDFPWWTPDEAVTND